MGKVRTSLPLLLVMVPCLALCQVRAAPRAEPPDAKPPVKSPQSRLTPYDELSAAKKATLRNEPDVRELSKAMQKEAGVSAEKAVKPREKAIDDFFEQMVTRKETGPGNGGSGGGSGGGRPPDTGTGTGGNGGGSGGGKPP